MKRMYDIPKYLHTMSNVRARRNDSDIIIDALKTLERHLSSIVGWIRLKIKWNMQWKTKICTFVCKLLTITAIVLLNVIDKAAALCVVVKNVTKMY